VVAINILRVLMLIALRSLSGRISILLFLEGDDHGPSFGVVVFQRQGEHLLEGFVRGDWK
jgi:hypothetical protein